MEHCEWVMENGGGSVEWNPSIPRSIDGDCLIELQRISPDSCGLVLRDISISSHFRNRWGKKPVTSLHDLTISFSSNIL